MLTANAECDWIPARCQLNGCELIGDDAGCPLYTDGMYMCNKCYTNFDSQYRATCCVCDEEFYYDEWTGVSMVFDSYDCGVEQGVYRSTNRDEFFERMIGPVPPGVVGDGYPCGIVCPECAKKELGIYPYAARGSRLCVIA